MSKSKKITSKTPKDFAKALGLTNVDAVEWEVRHTVT